MKLVMTLLVRNEADIVDAQVAFHLSAGVDFIIATDNGSDDGTVEILERHARAGHLHLLHEPGENMDQARWVTRMARLAATTFGADWVVNTDADEFWWPRGGSLKEVLEEVPSRYGVIRGTWRHFLPRPGDEIFAERMTVRLRTPAFPGDKATVYHAHQKVAHRGDPTIVIERGNHDVVSDALLPLREWHPIEVLHFSLRSVAQLRRKAQGGWMRSPVEDQTEHQQHLHAAWRRAEIEEFYGSHAVSDEALQRGLIEGRYAVDIRLRDVLRELRARDGTYRPRPLPDAFDQDDLAATAAYAGEVSLLHEVDGIVRAERRVEELERRLEATLRG